MKLAVIALLALSGCQTIDRHSALPPQLAEVPASLLARCATLVDIPDRDLSQEEATLLAGKERAAHGDCIRRNDKLIQAIIILEKQGKKR